MQGKILIKAIEDERILLANAKEKYVYENGEKTEEKEIQLILYIVNSECLNNQELRVKVKFTKTNLDLVRQYMYKILTNIRVFEGIEEDKAFDFSGKANVSYISFSANKFNISDEEEIEVFN